MRLRLQELEICRAQLQSRSFHFTSKMDLDIAKGSQVYTEALQAVKYLLDLVPKELHSPVIGIICGSGLGGLARVLNEEPQIAIPYQEIPHFPKSTGASLRSARCLPVDIVQFKVMLESFFLEDWARVGKLSS